MTLRTNRITTTIRAVSVTPCISARLLVWVQILIVLALLFHTKLSGGGQGGRPTVFQVGIVAVAALYFVTPGHWFAWGRVGRFLMVMMGVVALSWFLNVQHAAAVDEALRFRFGGSFVKVSVYSAVTVFTCIIAFLLGRYLGRSERAVFRIIYTVAVCSAINGALTIVQWIIETGGVLGRYNFTPPLLSSYGLSASISVLGLILSLPLWADRQLSRGRRFGVAAMITLCFFSAVIIMSRQTLVGILLLVCLYGIFIPGTARLRVERSARALVLLIPLLLFVAIVYGVDETTALFGQVGDQSDAGISGRINVLEGSLDIIKRHPVFGVGYGFWCAHNRVAFGYQGDELMEVTSPHNGVAQVASELGLVGLIVFIFLSISIMTSCYKTCKMAPSPGLGFVVAAISAILVLNVVSQIFSNSVFLPPPTEPSSIQYAFVMWLTVGLMEGIRSMPAQRRHERRA